MPTFEDRARSDAPPEEVWKLLYDPARFTDWWSGIETIASDPSGEQGKRRYTMYPQGYPEFPMAQLLETSHDARGVTISCLVSDLRFEWRLASIDEGQATMISVHVEIPEVEAHRLQTQRDVICRSLARLAELAATSGRPSVPPPAPWAA